MIIPKRDAKEYGALHIDNYLSFVGFCKKVNSDEICDVDVYLDGKIIETLKSGKNIKKVEEIYDIEGHGFEFELDEKYFDKSHLLEFKSAKENEILVNSGINTIDKNHDKFNEYKFLHSLSKPIDEEKIKDMYCKDAIGFLAVEENLEDKDFVNYIKELYVRFPQVTFKAFYFNDGQKKMAENVFSGEIDRFEMIIPKDIYDIVYNVSIFINNAKNIINEMKIINSFNYLIKKYKSFYFITYTHSIINKEVQVFPKEYEHSFFINNKEYNFTNNEILAANGDINKLIYNNLFILSGSNRIVSDSDNLYELYYYDRISLVLKYTICKEQLLECYIKINEIDK